MSRRAPERNLPTRLEPVEQGMQPVSWLRIVIILGLILFVLLLRIYLWLAFHWMW